VLDALPQGWHVDSFHEAIGRATDSAAAAAAAPAPPA
jgi:hypothetical protein